MPKVEPVDKLIDPQRCMGDWYVQIAVPTPFDRGARNGLEQYSWNAKKSQVNVKFTFEAGKSSKPSVVYQIGGVDSSNPNNTTWWVRPWLGLFYLPMKLPYIVLDIDAENYTYLTASSPSTTGMGSWLYIMTRQKVVSDEFLAPLRKVASEAGWDLSKSERVPQSEAAVPQVPGMPEQETAIKS